MSTNNTQSDKALQPGNQMLLSNGTILPLYLRVQESEKTDNELQLDTTGTYLSLGKKPSPQPALANVWEEEKDDRQFFLDNVFFFIAHAEEILSDSRMFLAPVPVHNGLAYTGTSGFRNPTLGVYLEWWMQNGNSVVKDKTSDKIFIYWFLSGSPLSGCNACAVVDEHGETLTLPAKRFLPFWRSFMNLNTHYDECKMIGEAYSLPEVKNHLLQAGNLSTGYLDRAYRNALCWLADWMMQDKEEMVKSRKLLVLNTHTEELRKTVAEYYALKQKNEPEIQRLRELMEEDKRRLKNGEIDNKEYQQRHTPMEDKVDSLEIESFCLLSDKLRSLNIYGEITHQEVLDWVEEQEKKEQANPSDNKTSNNEGD